MATQLDFPTNFASSCWCNSTNSSYKMWYDEGSLTTEYNTSSKQWLEDEDTLVKTNNGYKHEYEDDGYSESVTIVMDGTVVASITVNSSDSIPHCGTYSPIS